MIILSIWILLKKQSSNKVLNELIYCIIYYFYKEYSLPSLQYSSSKVPRRDWSLVVYFTSSAIYLTIYTVYSSLWTVNYNNLTRTLTEYFLCEALGIGNDCSHEFEQHTYPYFEGIAGLCRILVPIGALMFAVNSKGVKGPDPCCGASATTSTVEETRMSATNPVYY